MEKGKKNLIKKKKGKKIVDLSKVNDIYIELSKITPDLVIETLKKQFFERELKDFAIINSYLLHISKLTERFRNERIPQSLYEKIILSSLQSSRLKVVPNSDSQIYTPENEANHLYIILKGSVKIIKVQKQVIKMNTYDYFKMIINLRNKNETYLLKNTINENNGIFPIDFNDIEIIDQILLKIFTINRKETEKDFDYLDKFFKKLGLKYQDFGLKCSYREELKSKNDDIELYNSQIIKSGASSKFKNLLPYNPTDAENHLMEQEKLLHDKLNTITYDICQKYLYFLDKKEEFITNFELIIDKRLINNECFGDSYGSKYLDFVESAGDDLYLLMIKNNMINQMLDIEKDKTSSSQVDFLVNNYFFRNIKKYIFERYYLNIFEPENYQSGQKICEENTTVKYLYFIKKGKVRLSYNKSILEIHSLINIIKKEIKQKVFDKESNKSEQIIKYLEENKNYYSVSGDLDLIKPELKNKQERILMIYQENQCLGHESYYYGLKYLYTATAASDKVEIYKISITQLAKIFNNKNEKCYSDMAKQAEKTLFFLMKRFIKINELLMNFSKKRKETDNEIEKNQTIIVNKNISHNYLRIKTMQIKSSLIAKLLPNIQKYKVVKNPDPSKLFISNLNYQLMNKKLPSINMNETSSQSSSMLYQSDYEKNILNNNIQTTERNTNEKNLEKQILYKKLNHQRKSQLFLNKSQQKNIDNKTKDYSINNSILNNTKFFRENKNKSMSSIFLGKNNNIGLIKENNISNIGKNNYMEIFTNIQNNNEIKKRKLLGEKLQKFIKIKRNVMVKKNKIYNEQKNKLKAMVNIYNFVD